MINKPKAGVNRPTVFFSQFLLQNCPIFFPRVLGQENPYEHHWSDGPFRGNSMIWMEDGSPLPDLKNFRVLCYLLNNPQVKTFRELMKLMGYKDASNFGELVKDTIEKYSKMHICLDLDCDPDLLQKLYKNMKGLGTKLKDFKVLEILSGVSLEGFAFNPLFMYLNKTKYSKHVFIELLDPPPRFAQGYALIGLYINSWFDRGKNTRYAPFNVEELLAIGGFEWDDSSVGKRKRLRYIQRLREYVKLNRLNFSGNWDFFVTKDGTQVFSKPRLRGPKVTIELPSIELAVKNFHSLNNAPTTSRKRCKAPPTPAKKKLTNFPISP